MKRCAFRSPCALLVAIVACRPPVSDPAPSRPLSHRELEVDPVGVLDENVKATVAIARYGLDAPPLEQLVDAQVAAMVRHVREHGRGEMPAAVGANHPRLRGATAERQQILRLYWNAAVLVPSLNLDSGPRELSVRAFTGLDAAMGDSGTYVPRGEGPRVVRARRRPFTTNLQDGIGLITLDELGDDVGDRVVAILDMWAVHQPPPRAIVLDLSRCRDAQPRSALTLANAFAPGRSLWALRLPEKQRESRVVVFAGDSGRGGSFADTPLFIVTSSDTGPLAEAVAHALRYHRSAQVLGGRTSGEGRITSSFPLSQGARFEFVAIELLDPGGKPLRHRPVLPDACPDTEQQRLVRLVPRDAATYERRCHPLGRAPESLVLDFVRDALEVQSAAEPGGAGAAGSKHGVSES